MNCHLHNVATVGLSQHSKLDFVCTDPEQVQSTVQQSVIMHQRLAICVIAIAILDKEQLTVSADQKSWLHRRRASALAVGAVKFPSHQCSPVARSAPCRCWLSAHKHQRLTQTSPVMFTQMDVNRGSEHMFRSISTMNCQPDGSRALCTGAATMHTFKVRVCQRKGGMSSHNKPTPGWCVLSMAVH